ncbi:MAG: sodium-translocating pyrophosphatase [Oscillospiraceae bacterium]|jgi:K(+)-stimulated pyrophosphate-energized sodium pump|nr:sodium-translocating pyrophosphatase [Oscillospiraceae bacterium]
MDFSGLLVYLTPIGAAVALVFVAVMATRVLKASEGSEKMAAISAKVRQGANAYLKRQYVIVAIFFAVMFVLLAAIAFGSKGTILTYYVPFAFVTGGFFSGLSGFVGMKIATAANARTAHAASKSLNNGLKIAFSAGSVMGFTVVGLGLLDLSLWYFLLRYVFLRGIADPTLQAQQITSAMLTFGMGASCMALFARVGGGIFTKAADVGADLVGKVEACIPEDDPRNPAVIADNVGDNVGDVAGMGADLYESYVGSIISAMALGVAAATQMADISGDKAVTIPMAMGGLGVIASILGTFLVKTKEKASQKALLGALRRGTNFAAVLIAILAFPLVWFMLGKEHIGVYGAVLSGLIAGVAIGFFTEYQTSDTYKPTQNLAGTTRTGPATVIIGGISLGMASTVAPAIIIAVSILASYFLSGGAKIPALGLFGIALSAVGMLSTLGITLATDAYGPVADNAGGIAEMSGLPKEVRARTDALDSVGNPTAATGKGFAIGSAALTALALIVAYTDRVKELKPDLVLNLSITSPPVLIGLLIGAMLPFLFSALTMKAVGRAAESIVLEVRRQFKEITGLMEGKAEADYATCVDLCAKASLKEMILPTIVGLVAPVLVGVVLGPSGVVGLLAGTLVTGFLLAIMMANAGGAWDNAKKYVEAGNLGGKGSENHKAAVVGDTVGDPFKDTSGPSINILIKLLSMVSIVFAGVVLSFNLIDRI